ncbi:MAG: tRNA (adenosine(37)-N6)-threonylcarbamoyltransferase complex dimerization subunit type 1 TsaB [Synergistes sp.]|nr:tRNA (adenosine(37)-N6)-threonylcarbamoyltransferase complex dimerization subunit type 1 TsaB [Synergistes sp.]
MITLAVDCSGRWTSVGLASGGAVLAEHSAMLGRKQSEALPLIAEEVLKRAGVGLSDIELIAVAAGPGSYTGIRAGIAYGAALAEALSIKVVPLSSLKVFIWDMPGKKGCLAPFFRARQGYCYAAVCRGGEEIVPPVFLSEEEFVSLIGKYPDAAAVTPDLDRFPLVRGCVGRVIEKESSSGGSAALLGEACAASAAAPASVRGVYLRAPDIGPAGR